MLNRQATVLFLLIIFLLASLYWLVWPAWHKFEQAKSDLTSWKVKVEDARRTENEIAALVKKYENSEEAEKLLLALPAEEDRAGLLVQLEKLSSENGLILGSVEFLEADAQAGAKLVTGSAPSAGVVSAAGQNPASSVAVGFETLGLVLRLSGDVGSLRNFLAAVENNLRIMDVQSIDFKIDGIEDILGQSTDFLIGLNTYYRNN